MLRRAKSAGLTLGARLSEARVGDAVVWKRPAGEVELTIVAIRYPHRKGNPCQGEGWMVRTV